MSSKEEQIVKTEDGSEARRSDCRLIKGVYYIVGDPKVKDSGQCYQINGRYYRLSTGYIVFDELNKEYVLSNDSIIKGIIDFDEDGEPVFGSFSRDNLRNIHLIDQRGNTHIMMDESIAKKSRLYRYDKSRDRYAHMSIQDAATFTKLRNVDSSYKNSLHYDCREIIGRYTADYNKSEIAINDVVKSNADALGGLTFGLEFETVRGVVPDRITRRLGLIPLRDGSIEGLEYATIPLSGEKGLQAAIESCKALNRFTKFDNSCSLHLHMGGIPRTEEYLIALFKVLCLVQDEFFEMFPLYKKYNFGVKRKNYTQPFPAINMLNQMDKVINSSNIKSNFDVIYRFLSRGQSYNDVGADLKYVEGHPSDPRGTSKWNITSRYFWVNLIPIVFGNKQTVEFRIHTPTVDINKVLHYIYMCGAVLNYTKNNMSSVLSGKIQHLSMNDVIYSVYGSVKGGLVDALSEYVSERKYKTSQDNHVGDIRGKEDNIIVKYFDWEGSAPKKATPLATRGTSIAGGFVGHDDFDPVEWARLMSRAGSRWGSINITTPRPGTTTITGETGRTQIDRAMRDYIIFGDSDLVVSTEDAEEEDEDDDFLSPDFDDEW